MDYSAFDTLMDGVLVFDREGYVIYSNDPAEMLIAPPLGRARNNRIQDLNALKDLNLANSLQESSPQSAPSPYREIEYRHSDGRTVRFQASVQVEPGTFDDNLRWLVYIRDVDLEKRLQLKYRSELERKEGLIGELRDTQDQLIQFSKQAVLGQFVASITHELSNPLSYVVSSADELVETLNHDPLDKDLIKKLVHFIHRGSIRLIQISTQLKSFIHSPLSTQNFVSSDMATVIDRAVQFTEHFIVKNQITVTNLIPRDLPEIFLDPTLIEQVAINLIRNSADAIADADQKYPRKIEIHGKYDAKSNAISISFVDFGPGIPPEVMKKLFRPFFTTKPVGKGTGLGLSICSSIAEKHGGTLYASSPPGKGATFYLTLPVRTKESLLGPTPSEEESARLLRGLKVLIIDDEPWIRNLEKTILLKSGCEIIEAENGAEALEKCKEYPFDVAITDLAMSEMTGLEFAQKARELYSDMKIILLTGSASIQSLGLQQQVFDELITKPFPFDTIRNTIVKVIKNRSKADL